MAFQRFSNNKNSKFSKKVESLVSIRLHWSWSHKGQNHNVFSRTGKAKTRDVTGLSGYTRTSKVQYVTGASQSLYQE